MPLKKQAKYRFDDFEVDLAHRSLRRDGHIVTIGSRTFDLLHFLVLNPQRVVSKDEVMHALWPDFEVEENVLTQHIFLLRNALTGTQSGDLLILTVPERGYEFTAQVAEVPESDIRRDEPLLAHVVDPAPHVSVEESAGDDDDGTASARNPVSGFFADFRRPGPGHVLVLTVTLAILGFGGVFAWRWTHRSKPQSLGLVIADFENSTGNPQFDSALNTALTVDLQQSPFLIVASPAMIGQTLADMKAPVDQPFPPAAAREACTSLQDQAYLTGAIHIFASKYVVALQAFNCATGRSMAGNKGIADSPNGVVAVLDKMAIDLRKQLGESSQSVAKSSKPLFAGDTSSLEVLKAYSDAGHLRLQGKLEESATLLQRAVELDPLFAIGFASLGATYSDLGEREMAKASLTRAYDLRDTVDEPNRLSILAAYNNIVTGDIQAGIRNYKAWSEEYPRNPAPLGNLADLLTEIGKPALALEPARRSLELNPADEHIYIILARAQLSLGQFEQAANTCQQAINRHLDGEEIHSFLLEIAFLRLDQPAMDEQIAWAKGQPAEPYLLLQQGLIDFASGKAKAAAALFVSVADAYQEKGQNDRAESILSEMPRIEAELGLTEAAHALLTRLPTMDSAHGSSNESSGPKSSGQSRPADVPVAWAHVGETSRAEALLKQELEVNPTTTLWQEDFGPQIRAAVALNQQKPEDALEDLKPALPYDLRSFDAPALRGRAYLMSKQPDLAEAEFHKILDHPGIEPLSHNYPLAQLGLARALVQQGKSAEAGFAYKVVLQIWKDADPDLPRFKEAKAEYAKLTGEPVRTKPGTSDHSASKSSAGKR